MTDLAILTEEKGVARLTLNRPEARNALSLELIEALRAKVRILSGWDHVNVCIVAGAGKAFCAGMDLRAVVLEPHAPSQLLHAIAELTIEVRALPMVTIARVHGAAIGGGCGLVCVCDLAHTHADAKLGYPEVDLGVCPAVVAPWLVRRIGAGAARRMLLVGGVMTGAEAYARGLVSELVSDAVELDQAVHAAATRLRDSAPEAIRATKSWLNGAEADGLAEQVRRGAAISAAVISTPEARAALKHAFGSRR